MLILGMVFWIVPLSGLDAQTIPDRQEVGTSRVRSAEGTAEIATSSGAVHAPSISTPSDPRDTGSIPVPLPVETKPAETFSPVSVPIRILPPEENKNKNNIMIGVIAVFATSIIAYGASYLFRKNNGDKKDKDKDDKKCEDIKTLLEQKRKEFEDMVRELPKEKLKEMAKDSVLGALRKDEDMRKILDVAGNAKEKYDKLEKVIETLQKRYDLCTLEFSLANSTKVILVDAVDTFVMEDGEIFKEMYDLLETFPNKKIILTEADDGQFKKFNLDKMPYEVFTLKHNPEKIDPKYYEIMFKHFGLSKEGVVYVEHNLEAVKSAQSIGIETYHYDSSKKDLQALKDFLTENL